MHELGIMEGTLALVQRHAQDHQARRVTRVVVRIGALAGVEPESLRFAFDVVSRGTLAEGATFEIEAVPVVIYCAGCQQEFAGETDGFIFTCPTCGDLCGEIRRGRELELSRIEMN
ncbi:MAG: hydrogenase maturation nickel metallochaperone HypA [Verrucomicrobiota bacterium]